MNKKKATLMLALALTLLLKAGGTLRAQVLSVSGGLDNTFYDTTLSVVQPQPKQSIFAKISFENHFAGFIKYHFSVEKDAVLNYLFHAEINFEFKYLSVGLGLYFNSFDWTFEFIDRAMSGQVAAVFPDIFFARVLYGQTFVPYSEVPGMRSMHIFEAHIGFWLYNVIASANLERRSMRAMETLDLEKYLWRTKAYGRFEIQGKNIPVNLTLDGGYLQTGAEFDNALLVSYDDKTGAFFGGARLGIFFGKYFEWYLFAEVPYKLSGNMEGFMYLAGTGFTITFSPQ